jgi:DNA polymerase-1
MATALTVSDRPRLFLLDGMALAYRAHFALLRSPLTNADGAATGAVFGFLASLDRILEQEAPEHIVVVFDAPEPTFRHKAYPDYKATREKMPDELVPQLGWIRRAVEGYGLPFLCVPGYEADDVIGTLAVKAAAEGQDVWIVSGDKDMLQLIDEHVHMYNLLKPGQAEAELVGREETIAKFGVPPEQVVDVLGLMGDTSDNVPGVPGVGPKRATALVQEHGSLEAALAAADGLPQKKLRENLLTYADQARLSKMLVTIDTDVPLEVGALDVGERDIAALRALYTELDFRGRLERLESDGHGDALGDTKYHLVDTPRKVQRLAKDLAGTRATGGFAFDTETTGLDPLRADLVGLSFAWKAGEAWYVPVNLDPPMYGGTMGREVEMGSLFAAPTTSGDTEAVLDALRAPLEDASLPKCGQNMKYDVHVLAQHGVNVRGLDFDTMVASFCVDPGSRIHGLDGLALRRLGIKKIPTSDLIGKGKNQISMREVPVATVCAYACEDADVTWRLRQDLAPELVERDVERVFRTTEMPLLPVLVRMEQHGIRLDTRLLERMGGAMQAQIEQLEKDIQEAAGEEFNIRSTRDLGRILFEKLEVHQHESVARRKPKKTAKGTGYATDEATLQELAVAHPLPRLVLAYRSLAKLKSTYVDTLPTFVNPKTQRIHTSYSQTAAATGRLASSDPNLQNIPIRSPEGRAIREAFVPDPGHVFLSADYSQVELRLLAHLSGDEALIDAFRQGADVHRITAARIFKVPEDEVTPALRGRAKAINFGVIYGMGAQRLARETEVSLLEAKGFIEGYFATYPKVRAWLDRTVEEARACGYVTTMLGRKRYLPGLNDDDPRIRVQSENVAVNTPVQGTAADVIKLAMIRIHARIESGELPARMLLQIHDELLFEVPEGSLEAVTKAVRHEMETALPMDVPLVVDVGSGANWSAAH